MTSRIVEVNYNLTRYRNIYLYIYMEKIIKILPLVAGLLVVLFLSGKIIEIPNGTHEGRLIGAIGVASIGVFMFIFIFIVRKFTKRGEDNNYIKTRPPIWIRKTIWTNITKGDGLY